MERRGHDRFRIWLPLQIDSEVVRGGYAVSHDASRGGLLVVSDERLEPGARVTVTFRLPPDSPVERRLGGRVVRAERNDDDPDGLWPHRMAIAFDEEAPDLEALFQGEAR